MAEEGRLAPPRRPRVEDVDAEDLQHADERRGAGPDDERREHELEIARASQEQRHGRRQQRVLAELRRRHGVRRDVVRVVPDPRIEARRADEEDEQAARDPDGPPRAERREAVPDTGHERSDGDGEHGEVGQHGMGGERADLHREARLEVDVEEEERDRGREHDRRGDGVAVCVSEAVSAPEPPFEGVGTATGGHYTGPRLTASPLKRLSESLRSIGLRRSATAVGIYVSVAFGFLGTLFAARQLGPDDFGLLAVVVVATGFFQSLLDLTAEEALVKYGFDYAAGESWGRLRRLFRQALLVKGAGRRRGRDRARRDRAGRRLDLRRHRPHRPVPRRRACCRCFRAPRASPARRSSSVSATTSAPGCSPRRWGCG